jgi:hypothetical protein
MLGIANLTVLALASGALPSGGAVFASGEGFGFGVPVDNVRLAIAPGKYIVRSEFVIQACPPGTRMVPGLGLQGPDSPWNIRSPWTNPAMFEDPLGEWRNSFERTPMPYGRHRQAKGGSAVGRAARGAG